MTFRFYGISIRTRQGIPVRGLRIGGTSALAVIEKLNRMYPGCTVLDQVPLWVSEKPENSVNVSATQLTMRAIFEGPTVPLKAPAAAAAASRAPVAKAAQPAFKPVNRPIDVLARTKADANQAGVPQAEVLRHASEGASQAATQTQSQPATQAAMATATGAKAPEAAKVLQAALGAASVNARASRTGTESRHGYWLSPSTA